MVTTKIQSLSKSQASSLILDFFKQFQQWIKQAQDPTHSEVEKFLTEDFQLYSNGILISRDLSDHLVRLSKLRKKYSRIQVEGPLEGPIVMDNKCAIHYAFLLTSHTGQENQIEIMAIATLENHKFRKWTQVAHEKGKDWAYHNR